MIGPLYEQRRVPPADLSRGPSVYSYASTHHRVRSEYNDLLTSVSGTLTPADRTGLGQFHHIKYHLNRAVSAPMLTGTGGDFLPEARQAPSISRQACLVSASCVTLQFSQCWDAIADCVYRKETESRITKEYQITRITKATSVIFTLLYFMHCFCHGYIQIPVVIFYFKPKLSFIPCRILAFLASMSVRVCVYVYFELARCSRPDLWLS